MAEPQPEPNTQLLQTPYVPTHNVNNLLERAADLDAFLVQHLAKYGDNVYEKDIIKSIVGVLHMSRPNMRDLAMECFSDINAEMTQRMLNAMKMACFMEAMEAEGDNLPEIQGGILHVGVDIGGVD